MGASELGSLSSGLLSGIIFVSIIILALLMLKIKLIYLHLRIYFTSRHARRSRIRTPDLEMSQVSISAEAKCETNMPLIASRKRRGSDVTTISAFMELALCDPSTRINIAATLPDQPAGRRSSPVSGNIDTASLEYLASSLRVLRLDDGTACEGIDDPEMVFDKPSPLVKAVTSRKTPNLVHGDPRRHIPMTTQIENFGAPAAPPAAHVNFSYPLEVPPIWMAGDMEHEVKHFKGQRSASYLT